MAGSMNFEDVSDVILLFKDGKYLKLSEETLKALFAYDDATCIKINGMRFIKVVDEVTDDED